ncbi:MAG: GxxExxY protein [Kofleriaceae bacterium]
MQFKQTASQISINSNRTALHRSAADRAAADRSAAHRLAYAQLDRVDESNVMERIADALGPAKPVSSRERDRSDRRPDRRENVMYAELSYAVNGAAIEVHRHIGPGQYESVYEHALCNELRSRGLACANQVGVQAMYKGQPVGSYYADIVVERRLIIELKVVSRISGAHRMQVLTYLRASGLRLGIIMNFNAEVLWREIKRVVL